MNKFVHNIRYYFKYAQYAAKAELKSEVAGSYLNWLWWILDPLFFMLIYMFISVVVFGASEPNFPVFVFAGLTCWDYFNRNISAAVRIVRSNKGIVTKIYLPKYILLLQKSFENMFKMLISCGLVLVFMIFFKIPFTWYLFYIIPIMIVFFVLTFGFSCILLHFGIFVVDLDNVIRIALRMVFYMSGIFYNISSRVPAPYNDILRRVNPVALTIDSFRRVILYAQTPDFFALGIWFVIGILITMFGIHIIQKYENSYAKVI
jgi:ABC-type polysaccharide/polyol phosphate export permease